MEGAIRELVNAQNPPTATPRLLPRQNASFRVGLGTVFEAEHLALVHIWQAAPPGPRYGLQLRQQGVVWSASTIERGEQAL